MIFNHGVKSILIFFKIYRSIKTFVNVFINNIFINLLLQIGSFPKNA